MKIEATILEFKHRQYKENIFRSILARVGGVIAEFDLAKNFELVRSEKDYLDTSVELEIVFQAGQYFKAVPRVVGIEIVG